MNTPNIIKYHNKYWASVAYVHLNTGVSIRHIENEIRRLNVDTYKAKTYKGVVYLSINSIPKADLLGNEDFFEQVCEVVYDSNELRLREDFEQACYYATECNNADWYEYHSGYKINRKKAKEIDQYGNILLQINAFPYWNYNVTKTTFLEHALEIGRKLCGLFIFKNVRSMHNKMAQLPEDKEGLKTWLIPGYYGNQNRRIWNREENKMVNYATGEVADFDIHVRTAFRYWINPGKGNKLNKRQVYNHYKEDMENLGITPVGFSTMKEYINKKRMFLSIERDGEVAFNDKYGVYVPAERLKYSGSQWSADYSGSKLGYWKTVKDKQGKTQRKVSTLYVLRIMDTFSGKWLGFSVAESGESKETTLQGFKNTIMPLGHTAFELVTDNGGTWGNPFNEEDEMTLRLSKLFVKHRRIALGNKQANPAENLVRRVSELSRECDNWMMLGFNSSFSKNNANQANPEYTKDAVLSSKEEAIEQIYRLQERWNNERDLRTKKTRNELYAENQHPDLEELTPENKFFAFAHHTKVSIAECRGLIIVKQAHFEHKFQFADFGEALQKIAPYCTTQNLEVIVAYTAQQAHLYSLKGDYIMSLDRAKLAHKSFAEMTKDSFENLKDHLSRKHHFKTDAKEFTEQLDSNEFNPDYETTYMQDVVLNKAGKKAQEWHTEKRLEEIVNNAKPKKTKKKDSEESEELTDEELVRRRLLRSM